MAPTLTWERLAHHAHLEVLPALGGLAVLMGLLGELRVRWALAGFLPLALLAVGSTVLLGSIASYMCLPARTGRVEHPASPEVAPPSRGVSAPPDTRSVQSSENRPKQPVPHSGIGRATLAHLTQAEDELWRRWASPPASSLGASVVGPVASTAYSPHRSGAFVAFPERDRDALVIGSNSSPERPKTARAPQFRGPVRGDIALRGGATGRGTERESVRLGRASDLTWADEPPPFLSGRGGMLTLDAFDHPVDLESINPILPRLRTAVSSGRERNPRTAEVENREAAVRRFCSECSRALSDFRSWVECRFCRKPLCRQCLQESFEGEEAGACMECRAERARSYRSAAPARRSARGSRLESAAAA